MRPWAGASERERPCPRMTAKMALPLPNRRASPPFRISLSLNMSRAKSLELGDSSQALHGRGLGTRRPKSMRQAGLGRSPSSWVPMDPWRAWGRSAGEGTHNGSGAQRPARDLRRSFSTIAQRAGVDKHREGLGRWVGGLCGRETRHRRTDGSSPPNYGKNRRIGLVWDRAAQIVPVAGLGGVRNRRKCLETNSWPGGGIGRRWGFKIPCPTGHAGSSPARASGQ